MTKIALLSTSLAAMLVALLPSAPAQALNDKSFVSSTGSGTACTSAAPCADFGPAHNATSPGGEITCLDSGIFGGASIAKSITIDCGGTSATTGGFIVNGSGIVVRIRNLNINSFIVFGTGIDFFNGAALFVENCAIQNYTAAPAIGIRFRPTAPGSQLVVTDTVFSNNGGGSTGGGIVINPISGGTAQVALNRVTVGKNVFGIAADGAGSTGGINMTITDSVASGNLQDGIIAVTPGAGAPIGVMVKNTRSVNNNIGIRSFGTGVTVRVSNSTVIGNGTGLSFGSGGALLSFGNNEVQANGANGAFSGSVGLQ
jgi:hypothetical protein